MRPPPSGTSPRILIVDDDPRLCGFLSRLLGRQGYVTVIAHDGVALRRAMADDFFALVILDLTFAGGDDGLTLARRLRAQYAIPLIVLSGRNVLADKVAGLELGADDYVTKPFEPRELLARIHAVLRRANYQIDGPASDSNVLVFAGWRLDLKQRNFVSPEDEPVALTSQEFALLAALALRRGRVLSREQLLDLVANRHWSPYDRSIDLLVSKIRQKMGDTARGGTILKTVRGIGYVLAAA
ncbi:winged helix-turn-helix domain-containing protein [Acidiphilium iwatense]|nr:response regulator transcription factor [Acidiphilium iwatense]